MIELLLEKKGLMTGVLKKAAQPLTLAIDEDMTDNGRRQTESKRMLDTAVPKDGNSVLMVEKERRQTESKRIHDTAVPRGGNSALMNVSGRTSPDISSKCDLKSACTYPILCP